MGYWYRISRQTGAERGKQRSRSLANKRKYLWKRQNGLCAYCGRKVELEEATVDHVVPQSRGGSDELHNLVVACHRCNRQKADKEIGGQQ